MLRLYKHHAWRHTVDHLLFVVQDVSHTEEGHKKQASLMPFFIWPLPISEAFMVFKLLWVHCVTSDWKAKYISLLPWKKEIYAPVSWRLTLIENETRSTWNKQEHDHYCMFYTQTVHMSQHPDLQESFSTAQRSKEHFSGKANLPTHSGQAGTSPRKRRCLILHSCGDFSSVKFSCKISEYIKNLLEKKAIVAN